MDSRVADTPPATPAANDEKHEPVLHLDRQGQIVDISSTVADFLLYSRAEIIGRRLTELSPQPESPEIQASLERLLEQGHLRAGDLPLVAKDGTAVRCGFQLVGNLVPEVSAIACSIEECDPGRAPETDLVRSPMPTYGRAFEERTEQALSAVRNEGRPLALLSIQLDRAGDIPSTTGIERRPVVLTHDLPTVYSGILRPTDIVGRLSPGEYVVVLPQTDLKGALRVAERLRVSSADESFSPARGTTSKATVSIGVAMTRTARTTTRKLWSRARRNRAQARIAGGNRVVA